MLATQLSLLMEGAVVHTQVYPPDGRGCAAASAKQAAVVLIDHALNGVSC